MDTHIDHHDITLKEFETAYKSRKRNKASGIDDINSNIVLDFFEEFKDEMNIAVSSIFTGDNNLKAENYRPISVLLVFSKILQKICIIEFIIIL